MYVVVDVETTGGKYGEEGITEIAIYKFDGLEIIDQLISLINPEKPIQPFVENLTGINDRMLRNAPKFYEIAKRIVEITTDCVLVAHNASFDYRMLQTEFDRLGFDFERKTLCTVELSKKLIPDVESYKLGKLVRSLGIPLSDRHRAAGDARATLDLLKILLHKDGEKHIVKNLIKSHSNTKKPKHLLKLLKIVPASMGVYYLHNSKGDVIYIGKSKNMKRRVNQHFSSSGKKQLRIQLETDSISVEETGSELIALLKELDEIKLHKPKHNRVYKSSFIKFGLNLAENKNDYQVLRLVHASSEDEYLTTFKNLNRARSILFHYAEKYSLCLKLLSLDKKEGGCGLYQKQQCLGACVGEEPAESYNKRVQQLINDVEFRHADMVIVDRGRNPEEQSVILIENKKLVGFGYINLSHQITHPQALKNIIYPMKDTREARHIIKSHLRKHKTLKVISLNSD
ncbi:MAG: exonuclease domain-containing protein [Bacteroidota bacterium]|nr:exonuclease domain-containing protein [Bacteroidota bacterium]